jgi:SLT domain-containing protein/cell wall-associated NlpC family hydrolase
VSGEEKTRLYKDELLRAADQAALAGDTSTAGALRQMAAQLDTTSARTNNTEVQTNLFRTELIRNADYQRGPLREAYLESVARLDQVSGSNMTAEQKTAAFKEEMQRLRDRSGGVLRPELEELARRVVTMPDGTFKVTGTGIAQWTDGSGTSWTINPNGTTSSRVGGLAQGGMARSVLPGYTPGHDVHQFYSPTAGRIALSGGEGILRPEATRALGGERGLREINREARKGGVHGVHRFMTGGQIQSFREGGMFQAGVVPYPGIGTGLHLALKDTIAKTMAPVILQAIQMGGGNVLEWVRTQVGKPYLWGGVGPAGYDCSGLVSAAINVMRGQNPHRRLGSTGSMPWAGMRPGAAPMGGGISVGSFRGNPGHMAATVNGVNIESWGGGGVRMGPSARGASSAMFNERYYMPGNTAAGPGSGALEGGVGGGVTRWSGVVAQALSRLGQSQALVGTVLRRMQQESGGNPGAINNWDSNAARGTPSKGLMQVIDPTFAAYRDPSLPNNIWDPLANITASMRYALARYGSLSAAYNRAGGYDLGGVADGSGLMRKSVLAPERVLSPRQTVAFDRLVAAVSSPAGMGMDTDTVTVIATAAVRAALAQAAADADTRPQTVVQWQAREPLGHADLSFVAAETARLQAWNRRRSG